MSETPQSPLTGAANVRRIGVISRNAIIALYGRDGLDVSREFLEADDIAIWQCEDSGLKFSVPCVSGSAKFYAELEMAGTAYPEEKFEFSRAAGFIRPGMRVLDIGCGFAHFAAHSVGADYTGLEYSSHAVEKGRALGRNIVLESAEDHAARLGPVYDLVVTFQVLEHVCDPLRLLQSAAACLKPGGSLVVAVPADDSFLGKSVNNLLNLPPHHVTWWPERALRYAMGAVGLSSIATEQENLQPEHSFFFSHQMVIRLLRGWPARCDYIRHDFGFRILNKIAWWTAIPLARIFKTFPSLARGHTLVASGVKKS